MRINRNQGAAIFSATAVGFVGAVAFHLSGSSTTAGISAVANNKSGGAAPPANPTPATNSTTPSTAPATNSTTPSTTPSATAPASTSTSSVRSATGPVEQYGYGQLAVRVTVRGSKIVGLNVVGLQTAESYSQQLASQVLPMLHNEVLSAQNLQVNGISGATYTTEAYLYSIQSALGRLHVK